MKTSLYLAALLTTSALVATTSQATQPITISVGGYVTFEAASISEDENAVTDDARGHDFRTSTEVFIKAQGVTDSGLTYGAVVELEGDQNSGQMNGDETHMYVSSGWGRVELGDKEGAASIMGLAVTAPNGFAQGGATNNGDSYRDLISNKDQVIFDGTNVSNDVSDINFLGSLYHVQNGEDNTKITYYTPVFSGFQWGVSYTPDTNNMGNTIDRSVGTPPGAGDNASRNVHEMIETVIQYQQKYDNGLTAKASVSHSRAEQKNIAGNANAIHEDLRAYGAGVSLNYAGVTVGGSYVNLGESYQLKDAVDDDATWAYTLGVQYETGPWIVGVNYLSAEAAGNETAALPEDVEYTALSMGGTYLIAPGFKTYVEATFFDLEDDVPTTNTNDNDGSVFILGTKLNF